MWILNLIVSMLIPIFMIIYSNIYRNKAPKDINGTNGYKTAMSRLNRDTWEFANHYYNNLMRVAGWVLLVVSLVAMLFVRGKNEEIINNSGLILLVVQIIVILVCVIPTEKALRKTFDENGNRKND
ncbi:MAG TPA: SdpI family protein [Caproicibacter sp.]|nr:SdpI family protein [Caproicibacter sp.]